MSEFGQTGKWVFAPVTLCVGLVGAFLVFTQLPSLASIITGRVPTILSVHSVGAVFARDPDMHFMHRFPGTAAIPRVIWMANLWITESVLRLLVGFGCLLGLICPFPKVARGLYWLATSYLIVWIISHMGIFYCFRKRYLLEFVPEFRQEQENSYFIFGALEWPTSFWYNYCFNSLFTLYTIYMVVDLFYSWFLILTVGGSGWELMKARDLPGWEAYEKSLEDKYEDEDDEEAAAGDVHSSAALFDHIMKQGDPQTNTTYNMFSEGGIPINEERMPMLNFPAK